MHALSACLHSDALAQGRYAQQLGSCKSTGAFRLDDAVFNSKTRDDNISIVDLIVYVTKIPSEAIVKRSSTIFSATRSDASPKRPCCLRRSLRFAVKVGQFVARCVSNAFVGSEVSIWHLLVLNGRAK